MKSKYMDKTCYSILLVAVAVIGVQLSSIGSVSGQEEESNIASMGGEVQDAQNAPGVFPRIAGGAENVEGAEGFQVAENVEGAAGTDGTNSAEDAAATEGTNSEEDAAATEGTNSAKGANFEDFVGDSEFDADFGADVSIAQDGADGANGIGRDGVSRINSVDGADGADGIPIHIEIP
jgi:hypothetical protein